jgi:hypothetical protein
MKEEQIIKASLMAGLITRTLCTKPTTWETETLNAWTQEHADNKLLVEELTDLTKLNQQLVDFKKFKSVIGLEKINQRLFGKEEKLGNS